MEIFDHYTKPQSLLAAAQDITGSFADVGGEVYCESYRYARFWVTLDINNAVDVRFRLMGKHTSAGSEEYLYDPNKWTMRNSTLATAGAYREIDTDVDNLYIIEVELDNAMPYLQLQVCAGTTGATAGQIDALYVTKGY